MSKDEVLERVKKGQINVVVVGIGRIGLPTAVTLAESGIKVIGVDTNNAVVSSVNQGMPQIDEAGLKDALKRVINAGKFEATLDISSAVKNADVVIICVPTPVDESKNPDYSVIQEVSKDLAEVMSRGTLVIVESTVAPGIVEDMIIPLLESGGLKAGVDFGIASCPERSDPGKIMRHLREVPRIVGGIDEKSANATATFYEVSLNTNVMKVRDPKTANAVKLTENIFRDVNIALMNELAILYEKIGIDIIDVINAASTKWNFVPHYPGAGVGGPCLPTNSYYLIQEAQKVGYIPYIVRFAREINDRMPDYVVTIVMEALNEVNKKVKGSRIAILGVTYKPEVRDVQNTPAERIIGQLKRLGAEVACYDPFFKGEKIHGICLTHNVKDTVKGADCIVLCTAHQEFLALDYSSLRQMTNWPAAFVDTRGVTDPSVIKQVGFTFRGIGRN
jgi:nucleotide sugar dehydrogenase